MLNPDSDLRPKNEDIILGSAFISDPMKRADILCLHAFLERLQDLPLRTKSELMAEIRLKWWHEAMDEIEATHNVRYHPLTEAIQRLCQHYGLKPQDFKSLIEAQAQLIGHEATSKAQALDYIDKTSLIIARLSAHILSPQYGTEHLVEPIRLYGLAQLGFDIEAHIRPAQAAMRHIPTSLMPVVAHTGLALAKSQQKPLSPLAKRLKLLGTYILGWI